MSVVAFFEQADQAVVSQVGGKGRNLILLTCAGFPVPPGFVLTTAAYRAYVEAIPGARALVEALDAAAPGSRAGHASAVRELLAASPPPEPLVAAVASALDQLRAAHGLAADTAFAVRSSSSFEDLADAAFAGAHDTFLNVRGAGPIARSVRDCYVSLWGQRAVAYRDQTGFRHREAAMAVVVQRQVACETAGVGFSVDPVSGRLGRVVIDANFGLGESVVSGESEVDHFEVDKRTLEVVSRHIGAKQQIVVPVASGVITRAATPDEASRTCLDDDAVKAVAEMARRVEAHYGWPQDIEWGWQDGRLYLLQARPVTTIPPRWTRDESAERFPNPMTPLSWDFISVAFRRSLRHSLKLMGMPGFTGDWFEWFDGYIYGNQNAVELIASFRPIRATTVEQLIEEIPELRRRYQWVSELPVLWARDLDRYLVRLGRLSAADLEAMTPEQLWRHVLEALDVAADYFEPNIAISLTQTFLHRLLHALVALVGGKDQAIAVVDGLLAGCETKTALVNRSLRDLADLMHAAPPLAAEVRVAGARAFMEQGALDRYPAFAAGFRRFLDDHGHRELDMDYYQPTWGDQPWVVLDSIAVIELTPSPEDPADAELGRQVRHFETERLLLAGLPDALRFFFSELIRLARTYTTLDDVEHYQTTRLNPIARRAAVAFGSKLVARGVIDAPEDIFFFGKTALEDLVAGGVRPPFGAVRATVYASKAAYERGCRRTPAWTLEPQDGPPPTSDARTLQGVPGSPGRVTGRVFRVFSPEEFGRFPAGSVLVARTTNPAWTPLFYSAAGLVTESGGALSHGAVTAREMHLPAVMSVRGVMDRLADGQEVTLDGTAGIVQI